MGHSHKNSSINHWASAVQTFWERWDQKTAHCAREARRFHSDCPKNTWENLRSTFTVLQYSLLDLLFHFEDFLRSLQRESFLETVVTLQIQFFIFSSLLDRILFLQNDIKT